MDGFGGAPGEDGGGAGFMDGIQTMGIMNALRTGNVKTDMILAMMIPIFFRLAFGGLNRVTDFFRPMEWFERYWNHQYHQRRLVHKSYFGSGSGGNQNNTDGNYYPGDQDEKNGVLIKAILLYLHHCCNIYLREADIAFTTLGTGQRQDDDDSDDEDYHHNEKTQVGVLSKYQVIKKPPEQSWHRVGDFGKPKAFVEIQIQSDQTENGGGDGDNSNNKKFPALTTNTLELWFRSPGPTAIDDLIDRAHQWYLQELRKTEDNSRYLYDLKSVKNTNSYEDDYYEDYYSSRSGVVYKRYKLSDHKSFRTLFFHEKENLLQLIQHFLDRSGKYSIEGYPHKLGLLLHGPPGTGKTSLIKALALYTGRSIVNVPLSKITTNSHLMSIFFDKKFDVVGEDFPIHLEFDDVIFVMEDVDAASRVVHRRDGKKTADVLRTESIEAPQSPKCLWQLLLESSSCQELVSQLSEKSNRLQEFATTPAVLRSVSQRMVMSLPGLGFVGHTDPTLSKIGHEAMETLQQNMQDQQTMDEFLSSHAGILQSRLDAGTEVDDDFVDMLLGTGPYNKIGSLQRNVSISRVNDREDLQLDNINDGVGTSTATTSSDLMALLAATSTKKDNNTVDATGFGGLDTVMKKFESNKDALSLSGILNVLDGVVDTPGRILIMTTNHPEKLDPALIRPGRIDKKLKLGYMAFEDVVSMLQHYFSVDALSEEQKYRVRVAIEGSEDMMRPKLDLTPAQIEQMTAEHEDMEDMIKALEAKAKKAPPSFRPGFGTTSMSALKFDS